ncbi:MAG TPA: hypothetical protein PK447_09205, partial [Ignavibacteria bacterium]|nr:hypothetical protein [Ignavibacteria bacterium]
LISLKSIVSLFSISNFLIRYMQLVKRVLLSLFPDGIVAQTVNPASMFISFISAKDFFSVINRKIVENYKLNLFDVTLDPFEFKIGFGEDSNIKITHKKDLKYFKI